MEESELQQRRRNPWLAGLGNLFFPPLGHFYAGQAWRGIRLTIAFTLMSATTLFLAAQPVGVAGFLVLALLVVAGRIGLIADPARAARRQGSGFRLKRYNRWYVYLATPLLLAGISTSVNLLRKYAVENYYIPSSAMSPTLLIGDHSMVDQLVLRVRPPRRGEIVVFRAPPEASPVEKDFVKRVMGLPGDTVAVKPDAVTVDGKTAVQLLSPYEADASSSFQPHRPRGLIVDWDARPEPRQKEVVVPSPGGRVTVVASRTGTATYEGRRILVDGVERARLESLDPGRERRALAELGADPGVEGTIVLNGGKPVLVVLKGSRLELRPGHVRVNDRPLIESYLAEPPRYEMPPFRVPDGHFFVLGDNRNNSADSHVWGPLARDRFLGVMRTLYFSWDDTTSSVRWQRIGRTLPSRAVILHG